MRIKDILLLQEAPRYATVAWAKPINDSVLLNIYNKGEWHPINGSGNSGSGNSSSDSSGCGCTDVIIAYDTSRDGTWSLVQGNFENAMATLKEGLPINISIWDMSDTIKPHSITEYFPAAPNRLPFRYKDLAIEGECIIIITDTMRTLHDIVVWDHNGISLYEESQAGPK